MKIELFARNITLEDPIVELDYTVDNPKNETFMPVIVLVDKINPAIRIGHELPPQPYVEGTWTDEDVENAIQEYIKSISVK
jgi:hypothetical protein